MNLREIQQLMWQAITWPTGVEAFLSQADPRTVEAFDRVFSQSAQFGRLERVEVYARAYFWRLADILADQFEVCAWVSGSDRFRDLCTDYLWQHPPRDPDVSAIGAGFASFMRSRSEMTALADIADIEWAIIETVTAADRPSCRPADLAKVPLERFPAVCFEAAETTRLLSTSLPFVELWRGCQNHEPAPTSPPASEPLHDILVWRNGLDVYHRRPSSPEARSLRAMVRGRSFAEICSAAAGPTTEDFDATMVSRWLHRWLEDGLIANFIPQTPTAA